MNRRPAQSEIDQFIQFTNCSNSNFALNHLQKHANDMNNAIEAYFAEGHSALYSPN